MPFDSIDMTRDSVKDYYGKVLKSKADLQTTACCTAEAMPVYLRPLLRDIHDEVQEKFYGCGSPIPHSLEGLTVLDLGCGSGRDSFMLSRLVGPKGRVIGIDMTDQQLATARKHVAYHTEKYGYSKPNIEFKQGYIEDLESIGIASGSVDLVVSNCVINLSPNKPQVFKEIFRVLKPGGELYFSDVFADRRIPKPIAEDPQVLGECLGGAMYIQDFRRMMANLGCNDYRVFSSSKLDILNPAIEAKTGRIGFHSMTVRAFKLDIEDRCEDFGQVAYYKGTIPEAPNAFMLDDHHLLETNRPMLVCSNTAAMLASTRFAKHFRIEGDTSTHYGLFDCAPVGATPTTSATPGACC
ncbi:MAG: methyltransferase domain-containing protein [Bdellovibrionota bacterium]